MLFSSNYFKVSFWKRYMHSFSHRVHWLTLWLTRRNMSKNDWLLVRVSRAEPQREEEGPAHPDDSSSLRVSRDVSCVTSLRLDVAPPSLSRHMSSLHQSDCGYTSLRWIIKCRIRGTCLKKSDRIIRNWLWAKRGVDEVQGLHFVYEMCAV